jgi:hypothetical protein
VRSAGAVQLIGTAPIGALALGSPGDVVHAGTQAQLVELRVHGSELVGVVLPGNTRVEQARVSCPIEEKCCFATRSNGDSQWLPMAARDAARRTSQCLGLVA